MANVSALLLAEDWKGCDEQEDEHMAHEKELAPAQTIPSLGKAQPLQLADVWCDDGDDEPSQEEWMDMSQAPAPVIGHEFA